MSENEDDSSLATLLTVSDPEEVPFAADTEALSNSLSEHVTASLSSSSSSPTIAGTKQPIVRRGTVILPRDPIYIYSTLLAGAGSGALASILCAPLDLVRTRLQVWGDIKGKQGAISLVPQMIREILQREGWKGCFRGLGATLFTVPAFWGVYFPLYDEFKRYLLTEYPNRHPTWNHMGAAVMAGAVSDLICNPMFVVRTRLQTEALHSSVRRSIWQTARSLYLESGGSLRIFWRGMTANLLGLSHGGVQFPVYEVLKKRFRQNKDHASPPDILLASGLSKMTASLLTYPHEVIRSRMMDARVKANLVETCRRIYATEGWLGFYAGLPISLIRVVPNTCITFMTYEFICQWSRTKIREYRLQNA